MDDANGAPRAPAEYIEGDLPAHLSGRTWRWTEAPNAFASRAGELRFCAGSWEDLSRLFRTRRVGAKNGRAFAPALFRHDPAKPEAKIRRKANVYECDGALVDFDLNGHAADGFKASVGFAHFGYTSHSHLLKDAGNGAAPTTVHKFRIAVPFARTLGPFKTAAEFETAYHRVLFFLWSKYATWRSPTTPERTHPQPLQGLGYDPSCKDTSRLFFLPSRPYNGPLVTGDATTGHTSWEHRAGKLFDPATDIPADWAPPPDLRGLPRSRSTPAVRRKKSRPKITFDAEGRCTSMSGIASAQLPAALDAAEAAALASLELGRGLRWKETGALVSKAVGRLVNLRALDLGQAFYKAALTSHGTYTDGHGDDWQKVVCPWGHWHSDGQPWAGIRKEPNGQWAFHCFHGHSQAPADFDTGTISAIQWLLQRKPNRGKPLPVGDPRPGGGGLSPAELGALCPTADRWHATDAAGGYPATKLEDVPAKNRAELDAAIARLRDPAGPPSIVWGTTPGGGKTYSAAALISDRMINPAPASTFARMPRVFYAAPTNSVLSAFESDVHAAFEKADLHPERLRALKDRFVVLRSQRKLCKVLKGEHAAHPAVESFGGGIVPEMLPGNLDCKGCPFSHYTKGRPAELPKCEQPGSYLRAEQAHTIATTIDRVASLVAQGHLTPADVVITDDHPSLLDVQTVTLDDLSSKVDALSLAFSGISSKYWAPFGEGARFLLPLLERCRAKHAAELESAIASCSNAWPPQKGTAAHPRPAESVRSLLYAQHHPLPEVTPPADLVAAVEGAARAWRRRPPKIPPHVASNEDALKRWPKWSFADALRDALTRPPDKVLSIRTDPTARNPAAVVRSGRSGRAPEISCKLVITARHPITTCGVKLLVLDGTAEISAARYRAILGPDTDIRPTVHIPPEDGVRAFSADPNGMFSQTNFNRIRSDGRGAKTHNRVAAIRLLGRSIGKLLKENPRPLRTESGRRVGTAELVRRTGQAVVLVLPKKIADELRLTQNGQDWQDKGQQCSSLRQLLLDEIANVAGADAVAELRILHQGKVRSENVWNIAGKRADLVVVFDEIPNLSDLTHQSDVLNRWTVESGGAPIDHADWVNSEVVTRGVQAVHRIRPVRNKDALLLHLGRPENVPATPLLTWSCWELPDGRTNPTARDAAIAVVQSFCTRTNGAAAMSPAIAKHLMARYPDRPEYATLAGLERRSLARHWSFACGVVGLTSQRTAGGRATTRKANLKESGRADVIWVARDWNDEQATEGITSLRAFLYGPVAATGTADPAPLPPTNSSGLVLLEQLTAAGGRTPQLDTGAPAAARVQYFPPPPNRAEQDAEIAALFERLRTGTDARPPP